MQHCLWKRTRPWHSCRQLSCRWAAREGRDGN